MNLWKKAEKKPKNIKIELKRLTNTTKDNCISNKI